MPSGTEGPVGLSISFRCVLFMLPMILSGIVTFDSRAQSPTEDAPPVVTDVRIEGDLVFSPGELRARVRTQPNRRFLGIRGLTWWQWIYRVGESGALGRHIGSALMAGGEEPAYLSQTLLQADVERLQLFHRQEGYRQAIVEARVDTIDARRVHIVLEVEAGPLTRIRSVRYKGLENLSSDQRARLVRPSLVRGRHRLEADTLLIEVDGQHYSETMLLEERRRILSFLRNEGYAAVTRDSIRALVFPLPADSVDIIMRIGTGDRFRFGDVFFEVAGPETVAAVRSDTIRSGATGTVSYRIEGEQKLHPSLLQRTLQFEPGAWYDQSRLFATKRRLEATGLFSFTDLVPSDAVDEGDAPHLSHRIELRTRQRHRVRLETFMMQRTDVLVGTEELGTGVAAVYENANLFGGGEAFRLRGAGSVAADVDSRLFTSAQTELSASVAYPYIVPPFSGLDEALRLYDARTLLSLTLLAARRDELRLVIRGRGTARFRLEMQHAPTVTSLVDLVDLSLSNPDTLAGFRTVFLDRILDPLQGDPVQRAQIIEDYTQPQVNNALRYTLRSARVNPLRRDRGYSYEGALEFGGNLPYLLDRYVFEPGEVQGSLPGLPFFRGDREDSRLVYRQYARLVADARQYRPMGRNSTLALKTSVGLAHPTGASNVVPFDRRFYVGGGTSVRGWGLRELGPGSTSFTDPESPTGEGLTNLLGGDVKLEMGAEFRHRILRNVLAADWSAATFTDVGNVWLGPRNPGDPSGRFRFDRFHREIGVGAGYGIRASWDYLIIRLDAGYKIFDPARPDAGWLPDGMRPVVHFGIGHAI
jgi:outer membrane protein insertion porin family